jgi:hypothetical protein
MDAYRTAGSAISDVNSALHAVSHDRRERSSLGLSVRRTSFGAMQQEIEEPVVEEPVVEVRRSRRRKRTVSAYRSDGKVIVLIPDRFTRAEEDEWVTTMLERLERSERRRKRTDEQLMRRARELCADYLHDKVEPTSVRWVDNMTTRWASCTTSTGEIRLSDRLQPLPAWVVDYVLLHELAHLIEPNHNKRFWHWVDRYPKAERAKGYLEGVAHAASYALDECE